MCHASRDAVLIVAHDPAKVRDWARMLLDAGLLVWQAGDAASEARAVEVVLTDHFPLESGDDPSTRSGSSDSIDSPPGVVCVGQEGADVALPTDAAPREIVLACRLLAQIVRLRWQICLRHQREQRLAIEALTDPLTALPNRRAWDWAIREQFAGISADRLLCVAILDLDQFKAVNDLHGHLVGDQVLRVVGKALRESLRSTDFVARLGGDEFGLLLSVSSPAGAASLVERVRRRLSASVSEAGLPGVKASAGYRVIIWEQRGEPGSGHPLAAADEALRLAKSQGRDRAVAAAD